MPPGLAVVLFKNLSVILQELRRGSGLRQKSIWNMQGHAASARGQPKCSLRSASPGQGPLLEEMPKYSMYQFNWKTIAAVLCMLIATSAASAQTPMRGAVGEITSYRSDSGELVHQGDSNKVIHTEVIHQPDASWMRLFLDGTYLEGSSYLRVLSLTDGEVQYLDESALQQWRRSTAFFNGSTLLVELIASAGSTNRLIINELAWDDSERGGDPYCGYCGEDDRTPYEDLAISRLLGGTYTCTGTIIDENSHMISAGHCMSDGSALVAQFDIPPSNGDCTMNHPPVNDQFPVTGWLCQVNGPGNDWAAILLGTNGLGERPYDRYGQYKMISSSIPPEGTDAQLLGYGDDLEQCERADTLQESLGPIIGVEPLLLKFNADVTYGSSGSPLMTVGSQRIIGLATHCPCPNLATRVDHPNFVEARDILFNGLAGDTCETSLFATIGENEFTTTGAIDSEFGDPDETQCPDTYLDWDNSPDIWFVWQPPSSGTLNLSTCDPDSYDTSIVLYGGSDCTSLTQIACNGDAEAADECQSFHSSITDIEVTPMSTYYIRLGGWQGDSGSGTLWIDHIPAPATGACCLDDQCLQLIQADCNDAGGTYQGSGTDCGTEPCVSAGTGACCTGLGSNCQLLTESDCINLGGEYLGDDSTCIPNPCAIPTGACCIGSTCSNLDQNECLSSGGTYSGDGTSCLDLPCAVTCAGDFDLDGEVDVDDLLTIIAWFGTINPDYDLDGDGQVDVDDLLQVIGSYGPC